MDSDIMEQQTEQQTPKARRDCMIYVHEGDMHVIAEEGGVRTVDLTGKANVYVRRSDGMYDITFMGESIEADMCGEMQMWPQWKDTPVPEDPLRHFTPMYRVVAEPEVMDLIETDTYRLGVHEMRLTRADRVRREGLRAHYTEMARAKEFANTPEMFTPSSRPVFVARRGDRIKVFKSRPADMPGWSIRQERTLELRYAPWKMRGELMKKFGIPEPKRW